MGKGGGGKSGGERGSGKGKGASGGKSGGKSAGGGGGKGAEAETGSGNRLSSKPYKAAVEDTTSNSKVRQTDFDIKAVHLLDYLQKHGGRAGEALAYLKQAAQGVNRDDILNWRAYVYTLLRKFDEAAYKAMKEQSGDRVANNRTTKSEDANGGEPSSPPASAPKDPPRPPGDASTRQPPAPPPLQDYLAQAGFFAHPPAPPAPPPPAAPAPGAQDLELSAKAKEFTPGQQWGGKLVGCTPSGPMAPMYPPNMAAYYPPQAAYYPGYGYPTMPTMPMPPPVPPSPAGLPQGDGGKKGGGRRSKGGSGEQAGAGGGGKKGKEKKASNANAEGGGAAAAEDSADGAGDGDKEPAGQPPMWSEGSAGHDQQECKPCAFYHTKGCSSGAKCQFCHMCGPGEKKKRKKEGAK